MKLSATRDAYGQTLMELSADDDRIFALDCDLGRSTRSFSITQSRKDRFLDLGISEQDMISTAAGMASMGNTVFVNSFAVFLTGRAYDQIRQQVSLPGSNVKICGSSAGLTQGPDGATHQSVTDINLMRGLPNMTVLVPADAEQTRQIIRFAAGYQGPVYIRLSRYETPALVPDSLEFRPGEIQEILPGKGLSILVNGPVLHHVLEAARILKDEGTDVAVYNCPSVKPLNPEGVLEIAAKSDRMFTVEEHSIYGGLGSAVAEILAGDGPGCPLVRHGLPDCFGESGEAAELLERFGLDTRGILRRIRESVSREKTAGS